MKKCIKDLKTNKVKLLVRTCEKTYDEKLIKEAGIDIQVIKIKILTPLQEHQFPDGHLPSKETIQQWLKLVDDFFDEQGNFATQSFHENGRASVEIAVVENDQKLHKMGVKNADRQDALGERRIGVHCVAGLGRAPFFVAIALVNNGCSPSNAIELIRKNRPGALNLTQANYILEFKGMPIKGKGKGRNSKNSSCQCLIF
ncbi:UNKNOWN [Stylonychia lemnae]|uniref:Tyrosine specific protein phosphatases domain-containing protein n=1 Tax=Stylonychia lemnae TaxID=5949 RepID=A0A078AQQ4_STYLE|nr:UNKNOWN [Stylonychia lemnae]|eukprot:CDW83572.1 UNKNOWN [Stylonychia lemnae]